MVAQSLKIGRWDVEFYFCPDGYDADALDDRLYDFGAPAGVMREAWELMEKGEPNTGFTFSNPLQMRALVAVGPTTSGEEFVDTISHEVHHLAVAIAENLGVDLASESPAYIVGDSMRELVGIICKLGCGRCRL